MRVQPLICITALLLLATLLTAGPLIAASDSLFQLFPPPFECIPGGPSACVRVANLAIRADVAPNGTWALGTTGGDPDTPLDDDKTLIYGFEPGGVSRLASTFTTLRLRSPATGLTYTLIPDTRDTVLQRETTRSVQTAWLWEPMPNAPDRPYGLRVTETLEAARNPFTGRQDILDVDYEVTNLASVPWEIGVRALLDVKLGNNDGAPYFLPGIGTAARERDFVGDAIPAFWLAFESPTYDPKRLRSVGILRGEGVTPPDRVIIANWREIQRSRWNGWEYEINPTQSVTDDSGVALYWEPRLLSPGASYSVNTRTGIAGNSGGSAFLSAPVETACRGGFVAAMFVNNFDIAPLAGGKAHIDLPPGMTLAAGETAQKDIPTIAPGGTGSAVWQVSTATAAQGAQMIKVTATFDGGRRFEAESALNVTCPDLPTPTAVPATATATAVPSRTPTRPSPTATPFGAPTATLVLHGMVCQFIRNRVPPAAINLAVANPERVRGWGELAFPSLPPSPINQPKRWLSLLNIGSPYHPQFNPLVYKAACP